MEIFFFFSYCLLFGLILFRWQFFKLPEVTRTSLVLVLVLKISLGFAMEFIYTHYYKNRLQADIFKYFDDSKVVYDSFKINPRHFFNLLTGINSQAVELNPYYQKMNFWNNSFSLYNDNRTMIKFNALLRFVSGGYYSVHMLFVCFLSLMGLTGLMKVFQSILINKTKILFAGVYLLPSVLFWLSGVLKDGLLIFILGMLFYTFHSLCESRFSYKKLSVCIVMLYLLTLIKLYVLLILVPGMLAYVWSYAFNFRWTGARFAIVYFVALLTLFNMEKCLPQFNFKENLVMKQRNFLNMEGVESSGSFIRIPVIQATVPSIAKATPIALFTLLVRPSVFEARSPFILLAALENAVLLVLIVLVGLSFRSHKIIHPLFYFSIYFTVLLYILIGLVTPVMGAFVRYKVTGLPFLIVALLFVYDKETLLNRLPFLKKYSRYL